jgi:hypothetical protein
MTLLGRAYRSPSGQFATSRHARDLVAITRLVDRSFIYKVAQCADFGGSHRDDSGSSLALEVSMHSAGNLNLEWGLLAPAPRFLRTVRIPRHPLRPSHFGRMWRRPSRG